MQSMYKEKILKEIEKIPDDRMSKLYRVIHLLVSELMPKPPKTGNRGSLKGVWKGSQIDAPERSNQGYWSKEIFKIADKIKANIEMHDRLIIATAIYFDAILITKDEQIKKSGIVSTIW